MNNLLLDTNFLVHATDFDSAFFSETQVVLNSDNEFFVTSKNLSEFVSVITRFPREDPLPLNIALQFLTQFQGDFQVLYPDSKSMELFVDFLKRYQPVGLEIHDFEIAAIALTHQISRIVTYNQKDFEPIKELEVLNPKNIR